MENIFSAEEWRLQELQNLREQLHFQTLQYEGGCWDLEHTLEDIRADIAYIEAFYDWYSQVVRDILDAAKDGEPGGFVVRLKDGEPDEVVEGKPSPSYILHLANARFGDTQQRLTWLLAELVGYGYLSQEQARQFDTTPPRNERVKRETQEERERQKQWRADFETVLALVQEYAAKSGKYSPEFARNRARQIWNLAEHPRRDPEAIKRWCGDLRHESPPLLPAGAWVRASARLLVEKLKSEVLGK